jgi:hypothetical protein
MATRCTTPIGLDGLAATLLELLDVDPLAPPPDELSLRRTPAGATAMAPGFARLVRGDAERPRPVLSENLLFAAERTALRTERYTFIRWPNGKEELYDRPRDPGELHDIASRRGLLRSHRRLLDRQRAAARHATRRLGLHGEPATRLRAPPVSDVTRRALRSLGYVE